MYSINLEQRQYKTYILADSDSAAKVEIVPERGGIATLWSIANQDVFYLDRERFKSPDLSVRGGNPILFPLCGNLPDNKYIVDGKSYEIKQHGFARELSWQVADQNTDDGASLSLILESNQQTKQVYPFDFQLIFTYLLKGNSLKILQEYKNLDTKEMPFSAGFHPYFLCGNKNELELVIPSQNYQDNKTKQVNAFKGKFDFELEEIDYAFGNLSNSSTSALDKDRRLKLSIEYDAFTTWLVFWTVKGKEFFCLEPWSATRNAFNTGDNLTRLKPGQSHKAAVEYRAEFF
jgi:galactose mutarotase-like enzyme